MRPLDIFSYSFSAIKLRKLRAALTTLGVIIGIAAIVALLSLSQGFQNSITAQFQKGFATNTLTVTSRGFGFGQVESDFKLLVNDTQTINAIGNVETSAAIIEKTCFIKFGVREFRLNVVGVDFDKYSKIYSSTFLAKEGEIPSNSQNTTVVIGSRINNPWNNGTIITNINETVEIVWTTRSGNRLENKSYTGKVVAILDEIGGFGVGGPSDLGVYIPISQAQSFFGTNQCNTIVVQLKNSDQTTIDAASTAIKNAFSGQVSVISPTAILETISSVFSTIEIFLIGIAGISLLVAGVGIMNIMIVSLMERTREIGILKALGTKSRTVLLIFLTEAMIIGVMGGVIGIALGWGLANIFARFGFSAMSGIGSQRNPVASTIRMEIMPVLTPSILLGAFAFSITISTVFALYPAWRASRLKPVEALRYE